MGTSLLLPDRQDLEALAHAAFVNSQHGHWPIAHALATLALEEIGKSFLSIFASMNPEPFRAGFWKAFISHAAKIQMAHVALAPLADAGTTSQPVIQVIEAFGRTANDDHSTKLRGLYTRRTPRIQLDLLDSSALMLARRRFQPSKHLYRVQRKCTPPTASPILSKSVFLKALTYT